MTRRRTVVLAATALAAVFVTTGVLHFVATAAFAHIVPSFFGAPRFWVVISGVAELGCATLLLAPATRRLGGLAACVLLVIVYPANITMAVQSLHGDGSVLIAWLRLPLQIPLVLWAWWIAGDGQLRAPRWPVSLTSRTDDAPSSQ